MRLDVYLPVIRRDKPGVPPTPRSLPVRIAKRLLPASFFSDWETKRRGLARRWLRKLGPSWLAAPIRRGVQTVAMATFLILFFWVCWPYDARPARIWHGWTPVEIDGQTGHALIASDQPLGPPLEVGQVVVVVDDGIVNDSSGSASDLSETPANLLGRFRIESLTADSASLVPIAPLDESTREKLVLSVGPWSLHERPPGRWPAHYAENLAAKERIAAETFLAIDPLVSLSTAIASRSWVWSLVSAAIILVVCLLIPRGFCGYLCPLGTTIDLFDWAIGRRVTRFRVGDDGWWVHIKYYLLLAILIAAALGVLISGVFAAIPVITRGLLFTIAPLQNGVANGWHQVPSPHLGHALSLALFAAVLGLGFLKPRFWCKYVCPSGAVFSLGNLFRFSERKVESSCIHCNKCVEICPFDAIKADFTTRVTDCTLCQSCAGVCPTHAIKFVGRFEDERLKPFGDPPTGETALGRRGFIAASAGTLGGTAAGMTIAAATKVWGANLDDPKSHRPVRPPGSVPEDSFLQLCIRCGECFKACPSDVLQPLGFTQGFEGLWTPHVVADWAGCASSCNACGQVCPTGAIRPLPLEEKRVARMGLAVIDPATCLPLVGREACQLCVDECVSAGYFAIDFTRVGTELDPDGNPIEGTGMNAPLVNADACVGCGLCQTRCYGVNVKSKGLLDRSAIVIGAGEGKEDRLSSGSYQALRQHEQENRRPKGESTKADYLPDFLKP